MIKISLKEKIIIFAKSKYPRYVNGGAFELLALNEGKKGSNGSRRCRELANEGVFERRMNGKSVEYRLKTVEVPIVGTVENERVTYRPEFLKAKKLEASKLL